MSTRMTNLFLGVLALALGAAGGGIWAAGEPATTQMAAVAVDAADPGAAAEVPPCCRKGQKKCSHPEEAAAATPAKPAAREKASPSAARAPKAAPAAPAESRPTFVCPMHPEVTSSRSEDRCPKCGMFLEEAKKS